MVIKGAKPYFYHKDHLGSVVAITDSAGSIVQKINYSAFGKILSIKDKERRSLTLDQALDQPFFYTGREWDSIWAVDLLKVNQPSFRVIHNCF